MATQEIINFAFEFESVYTKDAPTIEIFFDSIKIFPLTTVSQAITINVPMEINSNFTLHHLEVRRGNHNEIDSQSLCLKSVRADDIDLKKILPHTKFYPKYPLQWHAEQLVQGTVWPEFHSGWLEWGWNGTWKMEFTSPFYTWLLHEL